MTHFFKKKTLTYFDSVAEGYERRSRAGIWQWLRKLELKEVFGAVRGSCPEKALDLGCGAGYYSWQLYQRGCRDITCVDISQEMIKHCDVPARKYVKNIEDFCLEELFDLVLCAGALEFSLNPGKIFKNVGQMLKEDGSFVILIPRTSLFGKLYQFYHRRHGLRILLFNLNDIHVLSGMSGLKIQQCRKVPLFSYIVRLTKK